MQPLGQGDEIHSVDDAVGVDVGCPADGGIVRQTDNEAAKQSQILGIYLTIVVDVTSLIVLPQIIFVAQGDNLAEIAPDGRRLV